MKLIKVAAGILNQTPLDWDDNLRHVIDAIAEARRQEVSLLCLPELCLTGYGCEDAFYAPNTRQMAERLLLEVIPHTKGMVVSVGLPIAFRNRLFNAACLLADGRILGFVAKRYLAGDGIHYEPRWFSPWPAGEVGELEIGGKPYPVGDLFFDVSGVKIGFEICEDAWVASRPGRDLYRQGIDIILNPSASHFAFGKMDIRERFVLEGSRAFGVTYVYTNLLGNEAGRAIYDGSTLIASGGKLLKVGPRFSYADFGILAATIDVDGTRLMQAQTKAQFPGATNGVPSTGRERVRTDFAFPSTPPVLEEFTLEDWERSSSLKEEEFGRALTLALFDYLRKSRSQGFVISLSGGADSSAVTALCYLMIELGIESIGLEAFKAKLGYIKDLAAANTPAELSQQLISCIYQSTVNSSDDTRNSAETLARSLNVNYSEIAIDTLVEQYTSLIEGAIGRQLDWKTDDIALQNIQARVRAPSVWLLTNLKNALLLSTSNRSEAAVGYATMDGDTAGSISPIAGIDKAFLRKWLRWAEEHGMNGERKLPGLSVVNGLQPSAELRPQEMTQTDEEDLMPYEVLDAIEKCAIRDKQSPADVLLLMQLRFGAIYPNDRLLLWVERFFRLWSRNQWKRERYAPSFHLDDENLDPKTWCRFPILSGGFNKELEEMKSGGSENGQPKGLGFKLAGAK